MKGFIVKLASLLAAMTVISTLGAEGQVTRPAGAPKLVDPTVQGEEVAVLAQAPNVPPPITRKHATKVIVKLEVREVVKKLNDGTEYLFWTFGGDVPGSFIRIREGDQVEFHLMNHPTSRLPHNIDLHAVTGPGGGAASSFTAPGHESQFSFKALNPGLYVYHCATAPVGMHVANGMYGLILVEPEGGLSKVDREFYVMQGELYTEQANGTKGELTESLDKLLAETPEYLVFNGAADGLSRKPLTARTGETVRIFFGVGGPNKTSSFHVIGEIFDKAYPLASVTSAPMTDVQTITVPPGGAALTEFKVEVPGKFILVDHALSRMEKGLKGILQVSGEQRAEIFKPREEIDPKMAAASGH